MADQCYLHIALFSLLQEETEEEEETEEKTEEEKLEARRQTYLKEVRRRLECAEAHYLMPECAERCPCYLYLLERELTYQHEDLECAMDFPPEIHAHIISFLTDSNHFHAYTTTCCALYAIGHDKRYFKCYEHLRSKKDPVPDKVKHAVHFMQVKAEFRQAIKDVDLWAHPYHTCYNESVNGFRTRNLPKHKNLPSTCQSRAALSRLQYNEGSGHAAHLVFAALNLEPNRLQQQLWDRLDKRREQDKKRKSTEMHKRRTLANCRTKAKRAKHELQVSKMHGDKYRAAHKGKRPSSDTTIKAQPSISCGMHV